MSLVWKLLRKHISISQFAGFFFANLFGMLIVLFGFQFYHDVLPVFTAEDSFMKSEYIIVSKRIGTGSTLSGRSNSFSSEELTTFNTQDFVEKTGTFTSNEYKVTATMGVSGTQILNSELFLQSVPDDFVDVPLNDWKYQEGSREVPIILPRTYINMYNFGYAQSRSLPKISEGLVGMIDLKLFVHGNGHDDEFHGRVIGFSNRLNEILVPQSFMIWSNSYYSPDNHSDPTRLLVKVKNPADEHVKTFLEQKGYEMESDRLNAEKTTYFLRLVVTLVMGVGLVISVLSFYILMLSIYLLVQKNASKLENLLLVGYSPSRVALPYQLLTLGLNVAVLFLAWLILYFLRRYYMNIIYTFFPQLDDGSMFPAVVVGILLLVVVTVLNLFAIHRKVMRIWKHKEL